MPRTRSYKKFEKNIIQSISHFFSGIFRSLGRRFVTFVRTGQRTLTVMIIPHSGKKVLNFQTNIFAVCGGLLILTGLISAFFLFNRQSVSSSAEISRLKSENKEARASLDQLRDETNRVIQSGTKFRESWFRIMQYLGPDDAFSSAASLVRSGDLSAMYNVRETNDGFLTEAADLSKLAAYLESAAQPVREIGSLLDSRTALFADIPGIWPLKGSIGHVAMLFGSNVHPITGQWYIHKGLDISTWRSGDPIVATANGQVVTVGADASFGNYVIIKHKHGIYTRYAHMSSIWVHTGDYVSQGHVIGSTGNTGISTGPHLHYEVHIGADVVDPFTYIDITKAK